jgi:hypothetical protein
MAYNVGLGSGGILFSVVIIALNGFFGNPDLPFVLGAIPFVASFVMLSLQLVVFMLIARDSIGSLSTYIKKFPQEHESNFSVRSLNSRDGFRVKEKWEAETGLRTPRPERREGSSN